MSGKKDVRINTHLDTKKVEYCFQLLKNEIQKNKTEGKQSEMNMLRQYSDIITSKDDEICIL